jgi:hypothetical protein
MIGLLPSAIKYTHMIVLKASVIEILNSCIPLSYAMNCNSEYNFNSSELVCWPPTSAA